jgi:hypothetical protein
VKKSGSSKTKVTGSWETDRLVADSIMGGVRRGEKIALKGSISEFTSPVNGKQYRVFKLASTAGQRERGFMAEIASASKKAYVAEMADGQESLWEVYCDVE